ncbi:MAG TPA: SurA N-terminal domain-containing protein, partial [Verrucomicrobiota bacterium]|nr:SurA N-terminal domain-containing protein [Verrucomicrobiota bacterium]
MFGTIRKHQNWLWAIIITLTIISFVVFFSPYSKMHDATTGSYGSIGGKKVTQEDYLKAQREVYLRYFFMTGRWPDQDAQR